jgi:hypothetical protein
MQESAEEYWEKNLVEMETMMQMLHVHANPEVDH